MLLARVLGWRGEGLEGGRGGPGQRPSNETSGVPTPPVVMP